MPAICLYFQVHQPLRIKRYRVFDIGRDHDYFNDVSPSNLNNRRVLEKVAQKCYLPANQLFLDLTKQYPQFKVSFSFSGLLLEQLENYLPEVLASFQKLVRAGGGRVELLTETYHHSLSFLYSKKEFERQIELHQEKIKNLFGQEPHIFRNTELIYNNDLARFVEKLGFKGALSEGADHILEWRSPNYVYEAVGTRGLKLLLKNYRLSDDIAFRFSSPSWGEYPLTAAKFSQWLSAVGASGDIVNIFLDYETFGEHQWADTGIFDFLRALPEEVLKNKDNYFVTPGEAVKKFKSVSALDVPHFISWADTHRDLSAWLDNDLQKEALSQIYGLEEAVIETGKPQLVADWRRLQTSDHFYYMCTKWFADGDVHKYFNPYPSPYEAFIAFMNAVNDLKLRIEYAKEEKIS